MLLKKSLEGKKKNKTKVNIYAIGHPTFWLIKKNLTEREKQSK